MNRRDFTKLISASLLTGAACGRPDFRLPNKVKPVHSPTYENIIEYSTTFPYLAFPIPINVETYEGIPLRIKGNKNEEITKGVVPPFVLASKFVLFDKHRKKMPKVDQKNQDINTAFDLLFKKIDEILSKKQKIAIIYTYNHSPFLKHLVNEIIHLNSNFEVIEFPIFEYFTQELKANLALFDKKFSIIPNISDKKVIVNFGRDILQNDPFAPYLLPNFNKSRQTLITFEDVVSLTGLNSTLRLSATEDKIYQYAKSILDLILKQAQLDSFSHFLMNKNQKDNIVVLPENIKQLIKNNIGDLIFLCNPYFPTEMHILTNFLNFVCKILVDKTKEKNFIIDLEDYYQNLQKMNLYTKTYDNYEMTIFVNYNPYYSLQKDLINLINSNQIKNIIQFSLFQNELSDKAKMFFPLQTYLEYWSDFKQIDGKILAQQKIVEQINKNSISELDFFFYLRNHLKKENKHGSYQTELLKFYNWSKNNKELEENLKNGVFSNKKSQSNLYHSLFKINFDKVIQTIEQQTFPKLINRNTKIVPHLDAYSNEYSKNIYLYELPEQVTGQSWNNPFFLSQNEISLNRFRGEDEKILETVDSQNLSEHLFSPYEIQSNFYIYHNMDYLNRFYNIECSTIEFHQVEFDYCYFINTKHSTLREISRKSPIQKSELITSLDNFTLLEVTESQKKKQLYQNLYIDKELQWAMIVDIDKCIGCNVCMLACQIENNIPIVGMANVNKNRDLYWIKVLRITREDNTFLFFPLMCQHCENAPCESVCPVGATSHSIDGINEMTYNRCIGSRFCMVNCPYKIRKFNFVSPEKVHLNYVPEMMNPFVTVRSRGISEKCTFCVQRINFKKLKSKLHGNENQFEVTTACQEACPAGAISFGGKSKLINKTENNLFTLLSIFNTQPNVFYKMSNYEQKQS